MTCSSLRVEWDRKQLNQSIDTSTHRSNTCWVIRDVSDNMRPSGQKPPFKEYTTQYDRSYHRLSVTCMSSMKISYRLPKLYNSLLNDSESATPICRKSVCARLPSISAGSLLQPVMRFTHCIHSDSSVKFITLYKYRRKFWRRLVREIIAIKQSLRYLHNSAVVTSS